MMDCVRCVHLEQALAVEERERARLEGERDEVARALLTAAQHERSRLATAEHQRAVADGWLDQARRALGAAPTVAEMAGAFQGGPQSTEWLREQREDHT